MDEKIYVLMTEDFKILNEETFTYKRNNNLCLMLLKDSGTYAVEIVSNHDTYGRKFCKDREQADKVFNFLTEKLSLTDDYDKTITLLSLCRKMSLIEMKFLFLVHNKKFGQVQIGKLISEFKLSIKSRVTPDKRMIIRVYLYKSKKCFGVFTGTFLRKDFLFKKT